MRRNGVIKFPLQEPTIGAPYVVEQFFSNEMFLRVKSAVASLSLGPSGPHKYHTMMGRWESSIKFDEDIEEYCIYKARELFGDQTLKKAFFFVSRYQIHEGCIPSLWEHYDQNGTQATLDVTIENSADWDLRVERIDYKQTENSAIVFSGQQNMHARPPYPTDDPSLYTTVLFLEFTKPDHWMQSDSKGITKYGNDGDVRYFNRNRFLPLPDSPFEQSICGPCHDYSNVLNIYAEQFGQYVDDDVELVDMTFYDRQILAPGIVQYSIPENSAITLDGLVRNVGFKMWSFSSIVGPDGASVINLDARSSLSYVLDRRVMNCHVHDPAVRLYSSLNEGMKAIMHDYRGLYNISELRADNWTLLRYEPGSKFHDHFDDAPKYNRIVSVTVMLNDDFEGGEMVFDKHDITIKTKPGTVVIFPSTYAFFHRINSLVRGNRQAAVRWYGYA